MAAITTTRSPSTKTVIRSFRLDEDVDKALHKCAEEEGISVNSCVNRSLRRFVVWDHNASRFGFVTLAGASLKKIMTYLSEDEVHEYARWVAENSLRDFLTFFFGEVTIDTVLKGLRLLGYYGGHFVYEESDSGHTRTVVLKHGRGIKWSIHYEEQVRFVAEKLGLKVETEKTENQVTFRIPLSIDKQLGIWGNGAGNRPSTIKEKRI